MTTMTTLTDWKIRQEKSMDNLRDQGAPTPRLQADLRPTRGRDLGRGRGVEISRAYGVDRAPIQTRRRANQIVQF